MNAMQMKIDDSISITIASLKEALFEVNNGRTGSSTLPPAIFTDEQVLARPPFTYIHALVKFFAEQKPSLGWNELLFAIDDGNSDDRQSLSRKDKLTFLSRLLTIVSQISGRRLDILVSPSKVLCGQDVLSTHEFLRALAVSTKASDNEMAKAMKYVLEEGDVNLYKRGVRARNAFTGMQAIVRGWLVRRQYPGKKTTINSTGEMDEDECTSSEEAESADHVPTNRKAKQQSKTSKSKPKKSKSSDEQALLESYQAVISRKLEVEDQLKVAESRLKRENDKLIRMLSLGVMHKTRTNPAAPYAGMPRPPMSAPSIGMNHMSTNSRMNQSHNVDEAFSDTITNFSERQRNMKQKERRIDDRESRLKQRFTKSKQKEAELKLQEQRISDLAGKIRKQQIQLKEQKLQFERAKYLEPEDPPEITRPCVMCTEKNIQLRDIRSKIRQRTRVLNQREAVVIGRAQELRRREIHLVKREHVLAETMEQQQSTTEDDLHSEHEEPPPEKQRRQNEEEPTRKALPDVRDAKYPPRKKGTRKRRRRCQRDGSSTSNQMNAKKNPMRSSFGEGPIPTIVEETPADEDDRQDEQSTEGGDDAESKSRESAAHDIGECSVEERISSAASGNSLIPTDIHKARQSLGMAKRKASQRRSTSDTKQKDETAPRETIIAQTPSPKKRHVFTFERQDVQGNYVGDRGRPPTRERKPKQHDDWISSFDVQMKCAMNRLKDLV